MACDHACAESAGRGAGPAVLRLYAWDPWAVSVGYNQSLGDVAPRIPELNRRGIDLVRRPTGGAAVLHADEVTYCVALPLGSPLLAGGPKGACARVHAAILTGLEGLGISGLTLHAAGPASIRLAPDVCFAAASRSEIAWRGRKLVGSAQRRLAGALLQHGSILLAGDQAALAALWPGADPTSSTTLAEAGGRRFGWQEVADAVRRGFERELGAAFEEARLEPTELRRIGALDRETYGCRDFLLRL
jgi:lipoyl(octanoyl) transferase